MASSDVSTQDTTAPATHVPSPAVTLAELAREREQRSALRRRRTTGAATTPAAAAATSATTVVEERSADAVTQASAALHELRATPEVAASSTAATPAAVSPTAPPPPPPSDDTATATASREAQKEEEDEVLDEFECRVCLKLLFQPVSLACGHTYCRRCLQRALAVKTECPLCRAPTHVQPAQQPVNIVIAQFIERRYPKALEERKREEEEDIEELRHRQLPVFLLPSVRMFPGMPLTLNVFEPRYVSMVQTILGGDRKFAMQASVNKLVNAAHTNNRFLVAVVGRQAYERVGALEVKEGTQGLYHGHMRLLDEDAPPSDADHRHALTSLANHLAVIMRRAMNALGPAHLRIVQRSYGPMPPASSPSKLSFWLASALATTNGTRDAWIACSDPLARLQSCYRVLCAIEQSRAAAADPALGQQQAAPQQGDGAGAAAAATATAGAGAGAGAGSGPTAAGGGDAAGAAPSSEAVGAAAVAPKLVRAAMPTPLSPMPNLNPIAVFTCLESIAKRAAPNVLVQLGILVVIFVLLVILVK